MNKQAPGVGRMFVMIGFAFSCFAILLYLWLAFGGSVPLRAKSYRVTADFSEAATLANESEVRISGVKVGEVKTKELSTDQQATKVEIEIDPRYAPLPKDTKAILRQKTLLGETYVELTPGSKSAPRIPDGGAIPRSEISETVQLDEIFRSFDKPTRAAFRTWLDQQGKAIGPNGRKLSEALGTLTPFAEDVNVLLEVLERQQEETRTLVRDTGVVFDALTERDGQLADLIVNSNRVFETTASRDEKLAETFVVLPTFIDEGRETTDRLTRFAVDTDPLITQLRPAARELSPTLTDLRGLAPDLRGLFRDLGPLITVSKRGIPAVEAFLQDTKPLLQQIDPFLRQLNPILLGLSAYRSELTAFFSNDVAATQATDRPASGGGKPFHYLRTANPVNPEVLATYPRRLSTNRPNPYTAPGGYRSHPQKVFGTYACGTLPVPGLAPPGTTPAPVVDLPLPPGVALPVDPNQLTDQLTDELRGLIEEFVYLNGNPVAPPCVEQTPASVLLGQTGKYPHLEAEPEGAPGTAKRKKP